MDDRILLALIVVFVIVCIVALVFSSDPVVMALEYLDMVLETGQCTGPELAKMDSEHAKMLLSFAIDHGMCGG